MMKRMAKMRKHFFLWIGAAALLLSFAACQPKEKEVAMFQTGMKSDTLLTLATEGADTPLEVPDRLTASAQSADGSVVLKADADIVLLGDGIYSISRVEGTDFSQETVDCFIETVLPGVALHNVRTERTRDDVQLDIDRHMSKRSRYEQQGILNLFEKELANYKLELDVVPERVPEIPYDGKLHRMVHDYGQYSANYEGLYISDITQDGGYGRYLRVDNNDDMTRPFSGSESDESGIKRYTAAVTKCAKLCYFDNRQGQIFDAIYNGVRDVTGETTVDTMAQDCLAMTPTEAQKAAEALLRNLGIEGVSMQVTLLGEGEVNEAGQFLTPPTRFVYEIICSRILGGAPNILCRSSASVKNEAGLPVGQWAYETIWLQLDDKGIVRFDWSSPHTVTQTVVENAKLLPFEKVQEVLTTMMPVVFSEDVKTLHLKKYEASISHAVLGLMRILDGDGLNSGLLVPVWAFYGNQEYVNEDGSVENYDYADVPIIAINAIDGVIIDVTQGY